MFWQGFGSDGQLKKQRKLMALCAVMTFLGFQHRDGKRQGESQLIMAAEHQGGSPSPLKAHMVQEIQDLGRLDAESSRLRGRPTLLDRGAGVLKVKLSASPGRHFINKDL